MQSHIENYCDFGLDETKHAAALASIADMIMQKCVTMQELIVILGDKLTGPDDKLRGRATYLLAEATNSLSSGHD